MTDAMDANLAHCGQPMVWTGGRTTWEGKPGEGVENCTGTYRCATCTATATLTIQEPA